MSNNKYARAAFRWTLLWAGMLLSVLALVARADCVPQHITPDMSERVNTTNLKLLVLEDPDRLMNAESVAGLPDSEFSAGNGTITSKMEGGYIWLRVCLQRSAAAPDEWLLTLLPPYLRSITIYQSSDNGLVGHQQGFILPFDRREVNYRGFTYPIKLSQSEPGQYLIRIDFVRRVSADVLLLTPEKLYQLMSVEYTFFGFYLGMLVLVIFINLVFWFRLKDTIYFRYALAMLSVGIFSIITGGYASQFVVSDGGEYIYTALMVNFCVCGALLTFFVQSAFQLKKFYPLVNKISWAVLLCYCLLALMAFIVEPFVINKYRALVSIIFIPVVVLVSFHALIYHKSVRLYAISLLPLQIIFLLGFLRNTGVVSVLPLSDHLPNIGALAHLLLLNMALAKRAWQSENDKLNAQGELLVRAKESERRLEELVLQRTYQLDTINSSLRSEVEEREQTEAQLRQALLAEQLALRTQQEFVAMVSHEFRSPLAVIDTAAHNLEYELSEVLPAALPRLQRIRRNSERMKTLLNNCLTHDRLATYSDGRMHLQYTDLANFLQRTFPAGQYSDRLLVRVYVEDLEVCVDPQLLSIAVTNLVDNALKYSPEDKLVQAIVRKEGDCATIDIVDEGNGIAQPDREKIFHKFYRAASVQKSPGAGLGLYLARAVAEQHGGSLELMSSDENRTGSCFRLTLPLA